MTARAPAALEQNSAYGPTTLSLWLSAHELRYSTRAPDRPEQERSFVAERKKNSKRSSSLYPAQWERVADLRVFRTTHQEWSKLIGWRGDMQRKGWRLLQVSSDSGNMIAVFGRTKAELLERNEGETTT